MVAIWQPTAREEVQAACYQLVNGVTEAAGYKLWRCDVRMEYGKARSGKASWHNPETRYWLECTTDEHGRWVCG